MQDFLSRIPEDGSDPTLEILTNNFPLSVTGYFKKETLKKRLNELDRILRINCRITLSLIRFDIHLNEVDMFYYTRKISIRKK